MDTRIILVYCVCDDYLKSIGHQEDGQCRDSDSELLTTALVAALEFGGNYAAANRFMMTHLYVPYQLSASRYSRRLHRVKSHLLVLFAHLAEVWKAMASEQVYALDTFPIVVCDNCRIRRCRIYRHADFHGYIPSKRRFFYGLKVHLIVSRDGAPVEFLLTPGATSDIAGLQFFDFDLPAKTLIVGDKAYNSYVIEDILAGAGLHLWPVRRSNSKRPHKPWWYYLITRYRKVADHRQTAAYQRLVKALAPDASPAVARTHVRPTSL